jgi:hypothetical protein
VVEHEQPARDQRLDGLRVAQQKAPDAGLDVEVLLRQAVETIQWLNVSIQFSDHQNVTKITDMLTFVTCINRQMLVWM